jgi:transcriptional regulator GlxA family with amidase domain
MTVSLTVVFALYPGVTHLDFTGPHQVLCHIPGARTVAASAKGGAIVADGLTFANLTPLADIATCDILCVPGGFGCVEAMEDPVYMDQVRRLAAGARYVTSVCTGSLILGAAGLLQGRRAACHWAWRDLLSEFGAIPDPGRVVRDGHVITGGGVTAGIDFALTLAAEIAGPTIAQAIQLNLEYAPAPPFGSGRPETAPPEVLALAMARRASGMSERRAAVQRAAQAQFQGLPPFSPGE